MANFPASLDNITEAVQPTTPQAGIHASLHNQLADAVNAIETSLLAGGGMSMADHLAAADPHSIYLTQTEGDARYPLATAPDPYPQYLTAARGDTLFLTKSEADALYAPVAGGGYLTPSQADTLYVNVAGDTMSGSLLFSPDNTYDIGALNVTRPRNVYVGTQINAGGYVVSVGLQNWGVTDLRANPAVIAPFNNVIEQRNSTNAQYLRVYSTYTDTANYSRLVISGNSVTSGFLGTGPEQHLYLGTTTPGADIDFQTNNVVRWWIHRSAGMLLAYQDNTYDIGLATGLRPKNFYQAGGIYHSYNPGAGIANDGTNFERFRIEWGSNVMNIGTQAAGTGAARPIVFSASSNAIYMRPTGTANWVFHPGGYFGPETNNAFDIGTASLGVRDVYVANSVNAGTLNAYVHTSPNNVIEQRNGTAGQAFYIYRTYTDASNYERLLVGWSGNTAYFMTQNAGTGAARAINFGVGGAAYWSISTGQHLWLSIDNALDVGSASFRPRTIYAATSFIGPGAVPTGGAAGQVLQKNSATNYDVGWVTGSGGGSLTWPLLAPSGTSAAPSYSFANATGMGFYERFGVATTLAFSGLPRIDIQGSFFNISSAMYLGWSSSTDPTAALSDVALYRDAAGVLAQRNGTNAQTLRIYNSYVGPNDYERLSLSWAGNTAYLTTEAAGTGAARILQIGTSVGAQLNFQTNNTLRWLILGGAGHLVAAADNTYNIGQATTQRPANIYQAGGTFHSYNPGAGIANDATNYERGVFQWLTNVLELGVEQGGTGGTRALRLKGTQSVTTNVNGADRFYATGNAINFNADNGFDIGQSASGRLRNLFMGSYVQQATIATPASPPAGSLRLYPKTDGYYQLDSAGVETKLSGGGGGGVTWPLLAPNGASGAPSYSFASMTPAGMYMYDANTLALRGNATSFGVNVGQSQVRLATTRLAWGQDFNNEDVILQRDAANTLAQRNGTAPQTLLIYNSYVGAVDYERLMLATTTGGAASVLSQSSGTGVARPLVLGTAGSADVFFQTNSSNRWRVDANGWLLAVTDNLYDIGWSGGNFRPRNIYQAGGVHHSYNPGSGIANDTTNYERGTMSWSGNVFYVGTEAAGTGQGRALNIRSWTTVTLGTVAVDRWLVANSGDFRALTDNAYDIGAVAGNRPRTVYAATSVVTPSIYPATGDYLRLGTWGVPDVWRIDGGGNLVTGGDNQRDIGGSGANRPRTIYAGTGVVTPLVDTALLSPTGNVVEQRNGTNPQTWRLYNSYTDASNYSSFEIFINSGQVSFRNRAAGSGGNMPLIIDGGPNTLFLTASNAAVRLQMNGSTKWGVEGTAGHWVPGAHNTYDIGWPSQMVRDLYVGRRISGDFSNATLANRTLAQTSTVNSSTSVGAIPNGTSQDAGFAAWGRADPTNSPYGTLSIGSTAVSLISAAVGTGVALPMTFMVGNAERLRIETDGKITTTGGAIPNNSLSSDTARANLLANPGFEVWSRGNGPFTVQGYFADRWRSSGAVTSISKDTTSPSVASAACAIVFTGASAFYVVQDIDNRKAFAARTVTFSMAVWSNVATGIRLYCYDGATEYWSAYHPADSTYKVLTLTVNLPTTVSSTLMFGVTGAGAGTYYLDNATLVVGSVAADYAPLHPVDDANRCFAYYQRWNNSGSAGASHAAGVMLGTGRAQMLMPLKTPFRGTPTLTYSAVADFGINGGNSAAVCSAIGMPYFHENHAALDCTTATSPFAIGGAALFYNYTATGFLALEWNP